MMTVRDPVSGLSLTYNRANWVVWGTPLTGYHELYAQTPNGGKGDLIAKAPITMIVEWEKPCKVESVLHDLTVDSAVKLLCRSIRRATNKRAVASLKRELTKFNAHTHRWK